MLTAQKNTLTGVKRVFSNFDCDKALDAKKFVENFYK